MRLLTIAAAVLMAALTAGETAATTTIPKERICPVGGAKYPSFEIGSTSSFGVRLDLQRLGPSAHLPYVECPNGFVVYKDESEFTADEIAKLTPLVASARYQAARGSGPEALRVVMQLEALGATDAEIRGWLFRVAFESEGCNKPLRREYLLRTVMAYETYLAGAPAQDEAWWIASIRRADLLRQLGRFDDSAVAADTLLKTASGQPPHVAKIIGQISARAKARDGAPAVFDDKSD